MSDSMISSNVLEGTGRTRATWLDRTARDTVLQLGHAMRYGFLTLEDGLQRHTFGDSADPLRATITVHSPTFYRRLVRGGAVGAAEAYMDGLWEADDLYSVIRILGRNESVFDQLEFRFGRWANLMRLALHAWRRNTVGGSRKNIHAHYDLGNAFFQLWLDPEMMYSSAIYPGPTATLQEASINKLRIVGEKLQLQPGDHLLEIGTGWGAMAIYAARHFGCRVTSATISKEQHARAVHRVKEAGLEDRVEIVLRDYRELDGQYDKLVSIEMIEAVGDDFLDTFFGKCSSLLKPDGAMLLQAITSPDNRYDINKNSIDFVKRYIFPGGQAPSMARMLESMRKATDLRLEHAEDFGRHYARTLIDWRDQFRARLDEVRDLGYDERFIKMWDYYLNYCAGGFAERRIGVSHLVFSKPCCQRAWGVGASRAFDEREMA